MIGLINFFFLKKHICLALHFLTHCVINEGCQKNDLWHQFFLFAIERFFLFLIMLDCLVDGIPSKTLIYHQNSNNHVQSR